MTIVYPSKRLSGSALPYTLAICLLVGVLLSSMVMLFALQKETNDKAYFRELAWDNLESGVQMVLYGQEDPWQARGMQLFGSDLDSCYTEAEMWGLYGLLKATGVHGPARDSSAFLFGMEPEGVQEASLFLADQNRPLALAGATRLEGLCYLPEAGVKRGIIGRTGYTGEKLIYGSQKSSRNRSHGVRYDHLGTLSNWVRDTYDGRLPQATSSLSPDNKLVGSWMQEAKILSSAAPIRLEEVDLSGKVLVCAPEIWVPAGARLDQVLLLGQSIYIEDGFEGRLQALASDTIEVGDDCHLRYPSALVLSHPESFSRMRLGKRSELEGMLVHDAALAGGIAKKDSYTLLDSHSVVYGNVHVAFNLDLQGEVQGNVTTNNFFLRLPGSLYENHLLNATISRAQLAEAYAMGLLIPDPRQYRLIERLK